MKITYPLDFYGNSISLLEIFGFVKGPKFKIRCGNCENWFTDRVMIVDFPSVKCSYCGAINKMPLVTKG